MTKKLILLILSAAICLSCTACGGKNNIEKLYGRRNRVYLEVDDIKSNSLSAEVGTVENDLRMNYSEYREWLKKYTSSQTDTTDEQNEQTNTSDINSSEEEVLYELAVPYMSFEGYGQQVKLKNNKDIEIYEIKNSHHTESDWDKIKKQDVLRVEFRDGKINEIYILKDCQMETEDMVQDDSHDFDNGDAEQTINKKGTVSNRSFNTTKADTNALRINKASVTITNVTINKEGDTAEYQDALEFGKNASLLIQQSAKVNLKDSELLSKAEGASGLFVYSENTSVKCEQLIVSTAGEFSPAAVCKGALLSFKNCEILTKNEYSSGIEALGGSVSLNNSRISTYGLYSPTILVKSSLEAKNSRFTSQTSEVLKVMGGWASFSDCSLSGTKQNFQDVTDTDLYSVLLDNGTLSLNSCDFTEVNNNLFKVSGNCQLGLNDMSIMPTAGSFVSLAAQAHLDLSLTDVSTELSFSATDKADVKVTLSGRCDISGISVGADSPIALSITANDDSSISLSCDTYLTSFTGNLNVVRANGFKLFVAGKQVL